MLIWKKAWCAVELMVHKSLLSAKTEHKKSTQLGNENVLCTERQVARGLILILAGHLFNHLGVIQSLKCTSCEQNAVTVFLHVYYLPMCETDSTAGVCCVLDHKDRVDSQIRWLKKT